MKANTTRLEHGALYKQDGQVLEFTQIDGDRRRTWVMSEDLKTAVWDASEDLTALGFGEPMGDICTLDMETGRVRRVLANGGRTRTRKMKWKNTRDWLKRRLAEVA